MKRSMVRTGDKLNGEQLRSWIYQAAMRSLAWVRDHLDGFNPLCHRNTQRLKLGIKASAELALVCSIASTRRREGEIFQAHREFASYLWNESFSRDPVHEYLLDNPTGLPSLSLYASLYRCGYDDASYRSRLAELLRQSCVSSEERTPASHLDFLHGLEVTGLKLDNASVERLGLSAKEVYRRSLLAAHPNLYLLTTTDAYAITHTIFFTTDFGLVQPAYFSGKDREYFSAALPRLLDFYVRRENWDLTAEMLIALRVLGLESVPSYYDGWLLLLSSQNADGSFSGPETEEVRGYGEDSRRGTAESDVEQTDEEAARDWIVFRDNYHTTLAVLLAVEVEHST